MTPRRLVRAAASCVLLGWAAALLTRPRQIAVAVAGSPTPPAWVLRILGARQALEHVALLATSSPRVRRLAVGIDLLHAVSMVAAALVAPRYRRAGLMSAAVAVAAVAVALTISPSRPQR